MSSYSDSDSNVYPNAYGLPFDHHVNTYELGQRLMYGHREGVISDVYGETNITYRNTVLFTFDTGEHMTVTAGFLSPIRTLGPHESSGGGGGSISG
jgi:hypothetical protein